MPQTKIAGAATTGMNQLSYAGSAAAGNNFQFSVGELDTTEISYISDWKRWNGYYATIPELQSIINAKAMWTVGKGYTSPDEKKLSKITGFGKDSFNNILWNAVVTYTCGGDFFAEKIGNIKNLKPLNPGTIKIISDGFGILKRYEQIDDTGKVIAAWNPDQIFHLAWNRRADMIHGQSTIEKLEKIIAMREESMNDLRVVFHRYVKPLLTFSLDTDDTAEIAAFKTKVDNATLKGENLFLPKDVVDKIERISIPQFSTLDPLPWMKALQAQFIMAEGVPEVILGHGESTTEATAKIMYLAFQQMVEWNQKFIEDQMLAQLDVEIKLTPPASIAPDLTTGNQKSRTPGNMELDPGQAVR